LLYVCSMIPAFLGHGHVETTMTAERDLASDSQAPEQIATNAALTAKEKIELLQQLKAEVTGVLDDTDKIAISPDAVDAAIEHVRQMSVHGQNQPASKGDI